MLFENLSFLVVEDHEFQRIMLVQILEGMGARSVHAAADGHSALEVLADAARPVDIVISDLDMPGMDGMAFIRHLGATDARVSLILASALERKLLTSIATMAQAYGIKLLGIVEKPLTPENLRALVERHEPSEPASASVSVEPAFVLAEVLAGVNNGEFEAWFQPKVDLATGRIRGAEALARWRHPKRGIVGPDAFIPLLEQHGEMATLTTRMLDQAAAWCVRWRNAGLDVGISVNLSLTSLDDVQLAEHVAAVVAGRGLAPRHVVLEVTESAATTDLAKALENLARLRIAGFGLSIDDYGTAYASMQQLSRIAFTELKIDQAFVSHARTDESARVILASSVDIASKLKLSSVAEGVETREDWTLVRDLGCEMAQGYFIAEPMEASAFEAWARHWRPPA